MAFFRRRLLHVCIGGCTLYALTACGNGTSSTSAASGGPTIGAAGVRLGTPAVHVAATDQLQFSPSTQTLHVGDIVEWMNTGTVEHTVTFDSQPYLSDPTLQPGATWEIKLTQAGTYPYRCTIHPGMNGTLVVK